MTEIDEARVDEIDGARDAIARTAAHLAGRIQEDSGEVAAEIKGRAEALKTTAEALSAITWGPQGGKWDKRDEINTNATTTNTTTNETTMTSTANDRYDRHEYVHPVERNGDRTGFGG